MSKMGQELEKRLDEAKYDLYRALEAIEYLAGVCPELLAIFNDHPVTYSMIKQALAKVEGK